MKSQSKALLKSMGNIGLLEVAAQMIATNVGALLTRPGADLVLT
eukprot:CAMPEP_0185595652 /NCGR_PEP_ID=MMETSP0434-20130131/79157_1 /TAXON_ID=626734 ORGANISM="Favella taraikaensis, Strain Fe Narragansett Bay" /NCGR_SAMPLE_ID=MMETSP0434 /ASSEMBLY_ACC=CAM_ASM_000379 /LENGTH=43 /DNA_ID= /DNA_START= /DNA_END= /DNA_ORIENTATION=